MKKRLVLTALSLLSIPLVAADFVGTIGNVWNRILGIGGLGFVGVSGGDGVIALTRILIWILLFAVFFAVLTGLGGVGRGADAPRGTGVFGFLNRGQALVVAMVMATIAAIFIPPEVLLATGTGWATAVALILIGGPIVGLAYLLITIPGTDERGTNLETRATLFVKFVVCLLLYWILSAMRHYVTAF